MLQHSPEPPENLYIFIFLYFLPDFGRNFVTYWYWNFITVTDFERKGKKERKKERKIYLLLFMISPFSWVPHPSIPQI
jgi:hypothetical protein